MLDQSRPYLVQTLAPIGADERAARQLQSRTVLRHPQRRTRWNPRSRGLRRQRQRVFAAGSTQIVGGTNPYVFPDNLPRVNARGGPGGGPGCWQPISRDLWPAPDLLVDNGAGIAPYNHFAIGTPWANEYVWGRQMGEYTINP